MLLSIYECKFFYVYILSQYFYHWSCMCIAWFLKEELEYRGCQSMLQMQVVLEFLWKVYPPGHLYFGNMWTPQLGRSLKSLVVLILSTLLMWYHLYKAWISIRNLGWQNLPWFDTSLHTPYTILAGDTWIATNVQGAPHLYGWI